jgi:hypothetical protein
MVSTTRVTLLRWLMAGLHKETNMQLIIGLTSKRIHIGMDL